LVPASFRTLPRADFGKVKNKEKTGDFIPIACVKVFGINLGLPFGQPAFAGLSAVFTCSAAARKLMNDPVAFVF
jgi:hypothetical protein